MIYCMLFSLYKRFIIKKKEPLTGGGLDGFLEAAEQANAIPQPQAWNGIDGLLNGKPFMPEASPADRAAAPIELAEKNAPRLGS